jgi:Mrp family chromosome partitioning ATPase
VQETKADASAIAPAETPAAIFDQLTEIPVPNGAAVASAGTSLAAAYEVEQFSWPETPDALVAVADAEFNLLGQELISGARRGRKVLLIASRTRGEGSSTVALALARLLGKRGQRVALVDADFCRPALADLLGVAVAAGWDDVLAGNESLGDALIESIADNVTLLPFRAPAADAPSVYRRPALAECLRALKEAFDLVCLDAGPFAEVLGPAGGSLAWAMAGIDAALLVRDVRNTSTAQVEAAGKQLETAGVSRWSVVENFVA